MKHFSKVNKSIVSPKIKKQDAKINSYTLNTLIELSLPFLFGWQPGHSL